MIDGMRRLLKFLAVGALGFVLDFTAMWALLTFAHLSPIPARLMAFAVTAAFTYLLNRAFTFADRPQRGGGEWISYALVSAGAAGVNLGVFVIVLRSLNGQGFAPYIAMPAGVSAGLLVNFLCYNFLVFRQRPHQGPMTER